VKGITKFHLSM